VKGLAPRRKELVSVLLPRDNVIEVVARMQKIIIGIGGAEMAIRQHRRGTREAQTKTDRKGSDSCLERANGFEPRLALLSSLSKPRRRNRKDVARMQKIIIGIGGAEMAIRQHRRGTRELQTKTDPKGSDSCLERANGFEPSTSTLARLRSTN
jgi:hypothetical protein